MHIVLGVPVEFLVDAFGGTPVGVAVSSAVADVIDVATAAAVINFHMSRFVVGSFSIVGGDAASSMVTGVLVRPAVSSVDDTPTGISSGTL